MSNNLNNDNETTLLFKKFQGVAQTQVLTSDTGALSYTGEPKKSLTNVFQENIFSENVPTDLSFTLLEIYNGVSILGPITEGDFSNNVNNQTIVTRDLSAGVFGVDLPLTYYNKLYLAPTNGTNQAWWFIDPGSTTSTNNNILKNMIPYLYNDVNPNTYTPIVEYYNGTNWVSEAQASGNGLNWSIDPASGILQFYQSNSILTGSAVGSPYQLNGITGGADISQNRPRISFIKYTGTFGSGTGGGGGGGSGLINVGKIDVSNNSVLSSYDVSGIYFDASGFDVSLNAGNTVTITNKGTSSGGIADLSYYFFNKPLAPTDGSGRLINTNLGGSTPYIRLNWTNPSNEQSALPYGTYTSYQIGATNESLVQNDRLPFFRHLHIEYLEYTSPGVPSGSPLLNSSWIDLSVNNPNQTVIPNTIIEAELTYGGAATDLCGNSPDPTIAPYTKLTYGGLDNSKTYQFRIYLDNSGTNGPFTAPVYGNDVSWNYLYIPNVSGGSIELGAFGAPNPPNQIDLSNARYEGSGSSTELKFDASLSTVPPNYADASLNTPFPISASLSLAYAFGCTICGEILSTSRQMPSSTTYPSSFNYDISSGLQKNGQVTFSYDTEPVPGIPSLVSFDISACPEYKYTIHKPFGINNYDEPNLDPSFNLDLSTSIILPYPSRPEACVNSGARLPLQDGSLNHVSGPGLDVSNASAYPANSSTIINPVWFITPSNPGFDVSLNSTSIHYVANNVGNDLRGLDSSGIDLGYLKADISNTVYDVSSASQFKGYLQQTNGNPSSNPHIDWTASSKEAGKTTYPFQTQGYWTEIDISNIGIKDISLSSFPDICGNQPPYSPYTFKLQQFYNENGTPNQPSGIKPYDFYIGQRPTESIVLETAASLLSTALDNQFFGQLRPSNSSNINFASVYDASLSNLDPWWRADLNIGTQLLRYNDPSPISIGSAATTPWPSPSSGPIPSDISLNNPNGGIIPVTFMTTTEQYSREKTETGTQFNIRITPQSNVLQSPTTDPSTVLLNFDSTGKNLWWDYTYNSNSNPSINLVTGFTDFTSMNYLAGPLLPANKSSTTATGNGTWPTDNSGTTNGFFYTYQHSDDISYNQLMWANGCFGSGGTYSSPGTGTDNPYIDYPSKFYNPGSVLKDYSSLSTTHDAIDYDLSANLYWNQVSAGSPPPADVTISGEYKWIVLKYSNLINKGFTVDVKDKSGQILTRGSTSTTQTPGKYLMYICEENSEYKTAGGYPYNGRSGWLDAQVKQGSGAVTNQALDGGGCWNPGVGYYKANQAGDPNFGGVASTLYLRIGIENNEEVQIGSVVVEPVP